MSIAYKLSRFRERFEDRFLLRQLTPAEELFALCNAYQHSKALRAAAAYMETDRLLQHTVRHEFGINTRDYMNKVVRHVRNLEARKEQAFGTRLREFIYEKLRHADSFPIEKKPSNPLKQAA